MAIRAEALPIRKPVPAKHRHRPNGSQQPLFNHFLAQEQGRVGSKDDAAVRGPRLCSGELPLLPYSHTASLGDGGLERFQLGARGPELRLEQQVISRDRWSGKSGHVCVGFDPERNMWGDMGRVMTALDTHPTDERRAQNREAARRWYGRQLNDPEKLAKLRDKKRLNNKKMRLDPAFIAKDAGRSTSRYRENEAYRIRHREYCRRRYKDPEYRAMALAKSKERTRQMRMATLNHYGHGKPECVCCGEREFRFLCFDHINGGGHAHIRRIRQPLVQWLHNNNFPEGFRILCWNCNSAIGMDGVCPHGGTRGGI